MWCNYRIINSLNWIDQLRWHRLRPMDKLAEMLIDHLDGILNYCRTKVPMGVSEAVNGNIKSSAPTWSRLSRHELSVAQGAALSRHQDRIPRSSESRVRMHSYPDSRSGPHFQQRDKLPRR
jgi:hypothetical protein